ncbi:MAG: hypothetical protein KDI50_11565 [Candidatus Competibacteraceae bacterium]|nr:hypothetical protein [Candidatus Competibacteraceae bacterium]
MKQIAVLFTAFAAAPVTPALGQTMYKCADPAGIVKFQQIPCTPTGGGEAMTMKSIPSGASSGISNEAKSYMQERDKYWDAKAKADDEESKRQDTLRVERQKAAATREQAAAQRETAQAIRESGRPRVIIVR